jgi:NitT/TauT family transport system substrate-binding protein
VFRSNVIRDRPAQIKAFVRAWFQAQDYWKANPEASKALIAKRLKIKPETVSTDNIQLSTLKENLKAFTPGSTEESLYHTAKLYADFSIRTGGLSTAPDIQKLIDPSFVQQLQPGS